MWISMAKLSIPTEPPVTTESLGLAPYLDLAYSTLVLGLISYHQACNEYEVKRIEGVFQYCDV